MTEPPIPNPIHYADPNPARPNFTPEELGVLFEWRDALLAGLMLPHAPNQIMTMPFTADRASLTLSALQKLLED
jgi:hypothetical protein